MTIIQETKLSARINDLLDIVTKANEGDAKAQLELGNIYSNSILVEKNCKASFGWILRSAEQENREAQFRLGDLYALGHGTLKSLFDAYKWYTRAAIQGYKKALIRIHNLYQEDIKMHCRGQINSDEAKWVQWKFKKENNIRELYEYRVTQNQATLNGAIDYYTNQFKHYRRCNQEDPIVQLTLAFFYQHGYGIKKCTWWAFEYYTMAAEQGNTDAQYNLGSLYQKHTDMKFNYRNALKWYIKSAQSGNIAAQTSLSYFYLKGLSTDVDYDTALSWYTKAAEAGDSEAQLILGKLYRKGEIVDRDILVAVKWYTLAAQQGNVVAQNCLSQLHQRGMLSNIELEKTMPDYYTEGSINKRLCSKLSMDLSKLEGSSNIKSLKELTRRAFIGDGHAMYEMGLKYYHGDMEFIQDRETGIKWIKNAANAKHKDAQLMIADSYKKGDFIAQDYHKSSIWYKKVAKQKYADVQHNVGLMYNEGLGVREDPLEASKWFIWAADKENDNAQYDLGLLRLNGRGLQQDEEEAAEWFYKSALQKNIPACCILGDIYFYGRFGIKKDTEKGLTLLEFAAKNGYIDAQKKIEDIYEEGWEIDYDFQNYIDCYTLAASSGDAEAQFNMAIVHLHRDEYIMAYNWFKQAKDNEYKPAEWMFQTPVKYDSKIKDYSRVIKMFIEVTADEINDLTYHIGFAYEHGVKYSGKQYIQVDYTIAKYWYLIASKRGDSRADYRLGIMHENGSGVDKDYIKAFKYHNTSSRRGNGDASFKLATTHFNDYSVTRDKIMPRCSNEISDQDLLTAFQLYRKASIMGHEDSTKLLQVLKNNKKNKQNSVILLKKIRMLEIATKEGLTGLQYQLGVMYEKRNDYLKAFKWLSLAAEIGVTDAYYRLGVLYEEAKGTNKDSTMAANMYQKATEKEHEDACYRLARLYQYGRGVELDYLKAYHFYKKAADMGHVKAYQVLNITLENKVGSSKDVEEHSFNPASQKYYDSLSMCKYVAENGDNEVQFKIGFAYEHSFPQPDYTEAYKWYFMAASKSHTEATYHLGFLFENGLGVSQDYHRAIQLYKQANQRNSGDATYRLAFAYHHGKGVKVDRKKAIEYYTYSAEIGKPEYQCELGRLYEEGELVKPNLLETLKWYTKAYLQGYDKSRQKLYAIYEDKPYEVFFFQKLFRNLSIATHGRYNLTKIYNIDDYGGINNRLGSLYVFGHGTKKNLNIAWEYFSAKYDNHPILKIYNFFILNRRRLGFSQQSNILKMFEEDEVFMNQFGIEEMYYLGMMYYDGVIQTQSIDEDSRKKGHASTDDQDQSDISQYIILDKDYSKAFKYLKKAADKNHIKALLKLGIMHHCGYGITKNSGRGQICFGIAAQRDIETTGDIATLYHIHEGVQDFTLALEWYTRLNKRLNLRLSYPDRKRISEQLHLGFGLLFEYGNGVIQDYQKAMDHYEILSGYNAIIGRHLQGLMYYYGKGVSVDHARSFELFEEASLGKDWYGGNLVFIYDRNDIHYGASQSNLIYCTLNRNEVIGESYYYLGLMYKYGYGVSPDQAESQTHFKNALKKGCKRAKYEIED